MYPVSKVYFNNCCVYDVYMWIMPTFVCLSKSPGGSIVGDELELYSICKVNIWWVNYNTALYFCTGNTEQYNSQHKCIG